jgi:2-phospho-L-lactate/phosphoenolpyruvate guanylyltransferase
MTHRHAWAVVLVKPLRLAKQRLASVLDASERAQLARVMLEDVLCALDACRQRLVGVMVVTADEDVMAIARRHDAVILAETTVNGLNAAIVRAIDHLSRRSDASMLVVPADLPQVSPTDIEDVIDLIDGPRAVALVRASDGGTNLLACRPAGVIAPSFGLDSFRTHCVAAVQRGVTPTVRFAPHLALDLDRPEDLSAFISLESATRTHAFLARLDVCKRLTECRVRTTSASESRR